MLWFLGFSSVERITVGYVFRDGRAKAIQLQAFCILLILRLFCAGSLLHKLQQRWALLCPNPPQELLSSREGAADVAVLGPGLRLAPPFLVLWTVFTEVLSCLRIQVCNKQSSKQKNPKNNYQWLQQIFLCLSAPLWPPKFGSDTKPIMAALSQLIQTRYDTLSVDLSHIGGYHIQMPILYPNLRSEKFLVVWLVQALQHSLLLCSMHTDLCIDRWNTWAPGSIGTQVWKPKLRMATLQHRDVGKAAYAAEMHRLRGVCKWS